MIVAPSILSADFSRLGEEVRAVAAAGADWIHIDVMDGVFVPNITIGPCVVRSLRAETDLPFDVHLMIARPERHVKAFAEAGADYLTVHAEATTSLYRLVRDIRRHCRAGVSVNPATPLCAVEHVLPEIDLLLLMSVEPGFGGQSFIPATVEKVRRACEMRAGEAPLIAVDGGVDDTNVKQLHDAGADAVVAGSYVFKKGDYAAAIRNLKGPHA